MKVVVLGGFLGSGKTTVLLQMAKYIVTRHIDENQIPLVIIENEVGEVSVDSQMLGGYQVRELFSGCICCTLTANLAESIQEIERDLHPLYLLVETTGMAYPQKVTDVIRQYVTDQIETIVLADAQRWDELMDFMDVFIGSQMSGADTVLLNKCDLVAGEEQQRMEMDIRSMAPKARICPICAREDLTELLEMLLEGDGQNGK